MRGDDRATLRLLLALRPRSAPTATRRARAQSQTQPGVRAALPAGAGKSHATQRPLGASPPPGARRVDARRGMPTWAARREDAEKSSAKLHEMRSSEPRGGESTLV